ncbi:MAG TPA: tetratricopeptide repeat protein [Terracidiphilus sp.]|nr:tetratricopeptide repeat protein [Terracidiphilus sp.]
MKGLHAIPLLFCLAGLSLAASHAQQAGMTSADQATFRQALNEVEAGKPEQAEPALRLLAERYPANDQISEALGLIYAEGGEMTRALPYLERASKNAPNSALDHANLGAALLKVGRTRESERELATAAHLDPRNPQTLSALGQAQMLLKNPGDAARAFSQAASLTQPSADLLYNWALALSRSNQTAAAAKVLEQIPADQISGQSESLAGDVEEKLGDFMSAAKHYQKAVQINPSEANLYALVLEFLRHWTWDAAETNAAYAVQRYPASTRLQLALGVAFYGDKRFPDAAKIFDSLLQNEPGNSMYADMLGRTCGEIAGGNANCDTLVTFSNQHPANPSAAFYAARQILGRPHSASDLDVAEKLLKRATSGDPKSANAWYEYGLLESERNQWPQCARMLDRAIALEPDLASAHYQLANAYSHLGRNADRKRELALFQTYSRQEKQRVDTKVREMTVFLTKSH